MSLIDSHCHLDFACFDQDRTALINGLFSHNVEAVVVPAVNRDNWRSVIDLAGEYANVHPALGIHPCFIDAAKRSDIADLAALIESQRSSQPQQPPIVAIGECGLDFSLANVDEQRYYFTEQIALAQHFKLPLIIHHRQCLDIILVFLRKFKPQYGGVIHAFSGSYQQANQLIDLGFKLGIGGTISYSRASKTRDVVSKVPLESLLLETDAPDMPIYGRQGQRNSPEYLTEIFTVLTLLREESPLVIEQQLLATTKALFGVG